MDEYREEMDGEVEEVDEGGVDWLKLAQEAYSSSTTWFDSSVRPEIEADIRQANSKHPTGSKYLSDAWRGKSKIFRPRTRAAIRKNEATAAAAFFSTQDVVSIAPVDDSRPEYLAASKLYQYLLQNRLTKHIPWFLTVVGAYQDALTNRVVISHQYWREDPAKGIDTSVVELVPVENLRIDSAANWIDPIGTSPYVIHLMPMYVKDVQARAREGKWREVSEGQLLAASNRPSDTIRQTRDNDRTDGQAQATAITAFTIVWVHRNIVEHEGEDWEYYTLGTHALLSEPRPLREVSPIGRPYTMGTAIPRAHTLYPDSVPSLTRDQQAEINSLVNKRLDNIDLVLNKKWIAKRGSNIDLRSLTRNVAGSVTLVDQIGDVQMMQTGDVTSSSYAEQDRLNADFDDQAGVFMGGSVMTNRKLSETVGGMNLMSTTANQMSEYMLRTFAETWVEPTLRQVLKLEQYYLTDQSVIAVAGEKLAAEGMQLTPELFDVDVALTVNVGIGAVNPQNQVERFFFGLRSLMIFPELAQKANLEEITKEAFGKLGYKDGLRFFKFDQQEQGPDPIQQAMMQLTLQEKQALIDKVKAETAVKNISALYSALQAGQTAVTIPGVTPVADAIAKSAGFIDHNEAPIVPQLPGGNVQGAMPVNTSPMFPATPAMGAMRGMETPENDGVMQ